MERYNQVPHLIQDTTWESNINAINITNKSNDHKKFNISAMTQVKLGIISPRLTGFLFAE